MPQIVGKLQALANGLLDRYPWLNSGAQSFNVADAARSVGGRVFRGAWSGISVRAQWTMPTPIPSIANAWRRPKRASASSIRRIP